MKANHIFGCILFTAAIFVSACDLTENLAKRYRLIVTIDGVVDSLGTGINGSGASANVIVDSLPGDTFAITYSGVFASINGLQSHQIRFNRYFQGPYAQELGVFHGHFTLGAHDFAANPDTLGIRIWWRDGNGIIWDSALGPQTDSYFDVTNTEDEDDYWEKSKAKRHEVKGNYHCTLYNAAGASKVVDNASFFLFVESAN